MEYILRRNFNGEKLRVEARSAQVDCMLFKAYAKDHSEFFKTPDCTCQSCDYRKAPTIIMCNPNALCYQHMVNHPHVRLGLSKTPQSHWLKYFVKKGFNVLVWNYRNYGTSTGTPDPYVECSPSHFLEHANRLRGPFALSQA